MNRHSLRLRLLGGAALWIVLALVVAGLAIGWIFTANVERTMREQLSAGLNRLVAQIEPGVDPAVHAEPLPDPRYDLPMSGLYWQVEDVTTGASWRSRSLWDQMLAVSGPADGVERFATIDGPGQQPLSALVREVSFPAGPGETARRFRIIIAEDRALLDESIRLFGGDLLVALAILGVVLMIAAWLQVQVGLRPLESLREGIGGVRRGEAQRLAAQFPAEVLPLVGEVNALLEQQHKSMEFARARAADLAHGLKTPLSVLRNLAANMKAGDPAPLGREVDEIVEEMDDRVDYQLRLSRLRMRTRSHQFSASLRQAVDRTVAVLSRTQQGERLDWQVEIPADLQLDIDPHDLMELVGVILENAAKWARTTVRVVATIENREAELVISDDGPGLTDDQIARLGIRGQRHDESRRGSGLGLAIALEVVALNDGAVLFSHSVDGGLEASVRLPRA